MFFLLISLENSYFRGWRTEGVPLRRPKGIPFGKPKKIFVFCFFINFSLGFHGFYLAFLDIPAFFQCFFIGFPWFSFVCLVFPF